MGRTNNSKTGDYKKKIRNYRRAIFYRVAFCTVIALIIGAFFYVQAQNRVYDSFLVKSEVERVGINASIVEAFNGKILTYSKDGANLTDEKGIVLWNQTYEMQNPLISINDETMAIGNDNGTTIYIMNSEKIIGEIDTKLPIRNFCVSNTGVVAAVLDDSEVNWIYLYDSLGNVISSIKADMEISGYPVDVAISKDGVLLGVSYLQVAGSSIQSKVVFYNWGQVGANYTDKLVEGYNYEDAIIPTVEFMNEKNSFAIADNRFMIYEDDQKPENVVEEILSEEIKEVFFNEKFICLVFQGIEPGAKYRIEIYDVLGDVILNLSLPIEYKEIVLHNDKIIVYDDLEVFIYNMKGDLKFNKVFEEEIVKIIPTEKSSEYLYITKDKIRTIQLQ